MKLALASNCNLFSLFWRETGELHAMQRLVIYCIMIILKQSNTNSLETILLLANEWLEFTVGSKIYTYLKQSFNDALYIVWVSLTTLALELFFFGDVDLRWQWNKGSYPSKAWNRFLFIDWSKMSMNSFIFSSNYLWLQFSIDKLASFELACQISKRRELPCNNSIGLM